MMNPDFNARKKKVLEQRHEFYWKQYEAVSQQICGDLNQKNIIALKEQLRQIEAEITAVEDELKILESADSSPQERHNTISQHLHKIDFTQARKVFQSHVSRIGTGCGTALFLLPKSLDCCGDLCVEWIADYLKNDQIGEFKPYSIHFGVNHCLDEFGLFEILGGHFNELRNNDDCAEYARRLRRALYKSLRSTTVVLLKFSNWEALLHDQARVFQQFYDLFWRPLSQEFPAAMREQKHINVKCVAVLQIGGKFTVPMAIPCEQAMLLRLQSKWEKQDISDWLAKFGGQLNSDKVADWTEIIFQNSKGKPSKVRDLIHANFG